MLLHEVFEENVHFYGNKIALQFENETPLTYSQADKQANELAHRLIRMGIKINDKVVVRLDRSIDQVIALLALFKIGAVYVPIEPPNPSKKIDQDIQVMNIITDVNPVCILSHRNAIDPNINNQVKILYMEDKYHTQSADVTKPTITGLTADSLAYILYSSGTTGKRKGIPIKHSGLIYWVKIHRQLFTHINADSRILGFITAGFDAHIWEYLMAWAKGASLHLTSIETNLDIEKLKLFLQKNRITDATLIPTVLRQMELATTLPMLKISGFKAIYSTGETCTQDIVKACEDNEIELYNGYGPTEATFGLPPIKTGRKDLRSDGKVPIVHLNNFAEEVRVYLLNDQEQEVLEGEGEIYIESPYLTQGYLNRPQETKENFVERIINGKMKFLYRTRNIAQLSNGVAFYKGRLNDLAPVKINGQLVYVQEVEDLIREQKNIQDVCVVAKEVGQRFVLLAYVTSSEKEFDEDKIKQNLSRVLMPVAIPSLFIPLVELPKTSNGKLDRPALLNNESSLPKKPKLITPPRHYLEQIIFDAWKAVLNLNELFGVRDIFRFIDGDSMKLTQIVSIISKKLNGLTIPTVKLFPLEELTVELFANVVYEEYANQKLCQSMMSLLKSGGADMPTLFFLPPITGEGQSCYMNLVARLEVANSCCCLNAPALIDEKMLSISVHSIAHAYVTAIREKQPQGPYYLIGWSFGAVTALEIAIQLEALNQRVAFVALIDPMSLHAILSPEEFNTTLIKSLVQMCTIINKYFDKAKIHVPVAAIEKFANLSVEVQVTKAFSELKTPAKDAFTLLQIAKHQLLAAIRYTPKRRVKGNVLLFNSTGPQDKLAKYYDGRDVFVLHKKFFDEQQNYTQTHISGTHLSIIQEPQELSKWLGKYISECNKFCSFEEFVHIPKKDYEELLATIRANNAKIDECNTKFQRMNAIQMKFSILHTRFAVPVPAEQSKPTTAFHNRKISI